VYVCVYDSVKGVRVEVVTDITVETVENVVDIVSLCVCVFVCVCMCVCSVDVCVYVCVCLLLTLSKMWWIL
jgi:hypothetical protein